MSSSPDVPKKYSSVPFFLVLKEHPNLLKKKMEEKEINELDTGTRNVCNLPPFCYFKLRNYITIAVSASSWACVYGTRRSHLPWFTFAQVL